MLRRRQRQGTGQDLPCGRFWLQGVLPEAPAEIFSGGASDVSTID